MILEDSSPPVIAPTAAPKWHTWLSLTLTLLLLGVGGWYLSRQISLADVAQAVRQAQPGYIALAVLVFVLTNFAKTKRWQALYANETPAFMPLFWALNLGQYINLVVPFVRLGEVARIYAVERNSPRPVGKMRSLGTLVVEKSLDLLIIALTLVVLLPFVVLPTAVVSRGVQLVTAVALALLCLFLLSRNATSLSRLITALFPSPLAQRLNRWLTAGLDGLTALHSRQAVLSLLGWCALIGLLSILTPYFLFRAFAMPFGLVEAILLHLGATAVAVPASTPGKIGVIEGAVLFILSQLGSHDPALNLSYALLFHLVIVVPQILLGLLALVDSGKWTVDSGQWIVDSEERQAQISSSSLLTTHLATLRRPLLTSVIVPAYNAEPTIAACVAALSAQTLPRTAYEIIVVDDDSSDATAVTARAAGATVLQLGKLGKSGSRNAGAQAAQGDILLFTDADCQPRPDWIAQMLAPFAQDPSVVGVKGAYLSDQKELVARFTQVEVEERYDRMRQETRLNFIDTYAAAYHRTVFLENGGFDVNLPQIEDQDFSFRLAAKGYKMVFAPQARVLHAHLTSARRYFWRKFVIGEWKAMLVHRYPERLMSDSRTPQLLKVQMGLTLLLPLVLLVAVLWPTAVWGIPALALAFVVACLPFMLKCARRDPAVLLIALPMLFLRAVALAYGYAYGNFSLADMAQHQKAPISAHDRLLKRLLDISLSLMALVLCLPLFPFIALAIKLNSPGPVLFAQERIGQRGRPFTIYKFRSMVVNNGLPWFPGEKPTHDPRVTAVGRFLRRWSLDELPQLWNVLKGEMSFIGPRPEDSRIVATYNDWHRRCLAVKPGLTGPMQVNGRADLSLDERTRLELDYIDNYSFRKDLIILCKTVPAVLKGTGAR